MTGIDLAKEVSKEVVELIKQDVRYKIAQIVLLELPCPYLGHIFTPPKFCSGPTDKAILGVGL